MVLRCKSIGKPKKTLFCNHKVLNLNLQSCTEILVIASLKIIGYAIKTIDYFLLLNLLNFFIHSKQQVHKKVKLNQYSFS